jgi:hypothetical protein
MKPAFVMLVVTLLLSGTLGCTGDDDDGGGSGGWGCDKIAESNACIQFTGSQWSSDQRDNYEAECTDDGGTVVDTCPSSDLVGTCVTFEGTATESEQNYYGDADVEMAAQLCTATGGTWSTP